ncbi:WhiB family transcriptional regulator [Cellulosimicrobium cellulans]|uniref:WhiB family transcriptional regulator n=1 Tax=Cellulosimicrobium cellulans TaxID=1710 RepID=UPI001E5E8670|nr:WhiB family transcriptional regulator [Cellulosimicrobium cellulans]
MTISSKCAIVVYTTARTNGHRTRTDHLGPERTTLMTTSTLSRTAPYTDRTASMQSDPEARHDRGAASVSFSRRFPIEDARCATSSTDSDWVPTSEQDVVPDEMAALCRRCLGRENCLLWALAGDEVGYWAATTTADRARMIETGDISIDAADRLQAAARGPLAEAAAIEDRQRLHPSGEGDYKAYRRGCRCGECRHANSIKRAEERGAKRATSIAA